MKISIITATYNSSKTIKDTLESVCKQTYPNIEHIVIDGNSKDGTQNIIKSYPHVAFFISEPDKGIYDALNKGYSKASGDVLGLLHSDDYFFDNEVVEKIADAFLKYPEIDAIYGDIVFVNDDQKIIRRYSSKNWKLEKMKIGKMPAHPSFFAKKEIYTKYPFNIKYKIAADYDQILRVALDKSFELKYVPITTTCMRLGGASTDGLKSNFLINKEILEICKSNNYPTNYLKIYSKYPSRILEFLRR
ncbi:MAG: glycosyltransferase family 2 protein [Bacteroidia bacterium]